MIPAYGLTQLVAPSTEPVTVSDVLAHSRIYAADADQTYIGLLITAAREWIETAINRQCISSQYLLTLNCFPGKSYDDVSPAGYRYGIIRLPKPPLISVDQIQYVDATTLTMTTLSPTLYQVSTYQTPGKVAPARYQVWPVADPQTLDAVQVTFTCGYGTTAAAVPERLKLAIKTLVAEMYEHREASAEMAANELPYGLKSYLKSLGWGNYT
jgi:uncharacterized phiE125 gp8 family phage protein